MSERGFGVEVRSALCERASFLVDQGFAERRDGRIAIMRDLLATLRRRDLDAAGNALTTETGVDLSRTGRW